MQCGCTLPEKNIVGFGRTRGTLLLLLLLIILKCRRVLYDCHDCDIPPHPVHPQSRLHTALFALNSPHPNPIHIQTLLPPVLAFACILQHLRRLCKRARRAAIPLRLARTSLTNREHSRPNANHGTRSQAHASKHTFVADVRTAGNRGNRAGGSRWE